MKKDYATGVRLACKAVGLAVPESEVRFHPARKWRFDFAWPGPLVALEVEGGVWTGGRHTRGSGFVKDIEKYNAAAAMGWRVFRCVPKDITNLALYRTIKVALDEFR